MFTSPRLHKLCNAHLPGYEDHSGTPDDTVNFTKLLATIRAKLDDLGAATGRFYGLTAGKSFEESGIDMI